MKVYSLLSRLVHADVVGVILKVYTSGIMIRFVQNESSKPMETVLRIEGLIRLNGGGDIHGLLGRGCHDFANQWFFIPGTSAVPYHLSTMAVTVPFKADQPLGQLKLELEAAVMKALEPTPA